MDINQLRIKALRLAMGQDSQKDFANKYGLDASYLSQLLNGHRKLGEKAALTLEDKIGLPGGSLLSPPQGDNADAEARMEFNSPSEADYALIPQFKAHGSCGDGYLNDHVEVTEGLVFKRDWLRKMNARPENLFVMYAHGDSMEPYIFEGDVVLFDTSQTEPRDKQVYVIRRPDGGNSIKRLIQQLSGAWVIRSDSPDKTANPDEPVSGSSIHSMPILGRVIWRGGGVG